MKQLITILVALVSLTASGQVKQTYPQYGGKWKRLQIDSAIKIPMTIVGIKDTNAGVDTAQLRYDPADSTLKYHTGYQWLSASGSTTTTVNPDGCIIGCTVTWIENYDYEVVESYYYIGNTLYHSPTATITLDPADGTDDRIDLFVLTTSNTADKVTGAPTTPPVEPTFDPSTQLKIAFAFVENGTTEPTVTQDWLYRENAGTPTEWAYTDNSANLNPASGSNPYGGSTVDIEGTTVAAGNSFTLTDLATQNFSQYDGLVFKIRSKAAWSRSISIRFFNGTTAVGNVVIFGEGLFGFVSATTGAYQNINIPISSFGAIAGADRVTFTRMTGGGTIGFYLDDIQLLLTGSTVGTPQSLQNTSDATSHTVGLSNSTTSFKIAEGSNITITTTGTGQNGIATIAAAGSVGEANTASNVGGGLGLFKQKTGVDLEFGTFAAADFNTAADVMSIDYVNGQAASGAAKGFLTAADWTTFNNKLSAEVDGSISNELQTIANTSDATSHTATLSNSGGSLKFIEGTNVTFTTGGTGLDGEVTISFSGTSQWTTTGSDIYYNTGLVGIGNTAPTSKFHVETGSIGVTQSDAYGILLRTPTAAALGAQQMSPPLVIASNGWATTPSTSQDVRYRFDVFPIQGSGNPSGNLQIASSVNAGAYTNRLTVFSGGGVDVPTGTLSVASAVTINSNQLQVSPIAQVSNHYAAGGTAAAGVNLYHLPTRTWSAAQDGLVNFFGQPSVTEASSGVHNLLANVFVGRQNIINGAGTTTNAASLYVLGSATGTAAVTNNYAVWVDSGLVRLDEGIIGTATNDAAPTGTIGEELNSAISTYTNFSTTATYQNIASITLTAGDWDVSAFFTYSSNAATITAASNAIFVISTTTASAAGATEGVNIAYVPQAALLGTSLFSEAISPYRISISGTTTYYLNAQATFTLGNPQYVGSIRARRLR